MKYKSVVATRRGGPEVLQVVENDLRPPAPGEAQVSAPDISCRYGTTPFPPRVPFVPGYAITGVVDALGSRRPSARDKTEDFAAVILRSEPEGLDVVFDGMGEAYIQAGNALLRRGGRWVGYANPGSYGATFRLLGRVLLYNLLPNGKSVAYYGTGAVRFNRRPFLEDWAALFKLLEEGKIQPVIVDKLPLLEAAQANTRLESGQVTGNLVLVAPELL